METFETLWKLLFIQPHGNPERLAKLWAMLANKRRKPSGGWEPPLPLILAAWDVTMPEEKQLRFKEHIQSAHDNGQIDAIGSYLRSLSEQDWYHFGEL